MTSCNKNEYVDYKPHYSTHNNEHTYGAVKLDSIEFTKTIQVLEYYGEDYKAQNGNVILITKKLNDNWELVWNYTTKANDIKWLNAHPVE